MKRKVQVQVWTAAKSPTKSLTKSLRPIRPAAHLVRPHSQPISPSATLPELLPPTPPPTVLELQSPQPVPSVARGPSRFGTTLSAILLTSAVSLVIGGSWLAVKLIVNPASVSWVSQILPDWGEFAPSKSQSLSDIAAEVARAGRQLGQPIHFSTYPGMTQSQSGFHHLLLPILQPIKYCVPNCNQIAELRVYRPKASGSRVVYELIDRMAVTGPAEVEAIAPLSNSLTSSTRTLPLTSVTFMDSNAPAGLWLQLSGEWQRGSRVLYGQVVDYDPDRARLSLLQSWSSPAGQLPQWRQVTGNSTPELVVNQSVGLEPQFQVFQLKRSRSLIQPTRLEPITLTEAVLQDRSYETELLLARNGLWSLALARLQALKQTEPSWPAAAQAQLDLIALHAEVTQSQADQDWASPTQQVLAQVIDGRWSKSLAALKSASQSGYDIRHLLDTNSDRLWQRIETALRVMARQADLQAWGMLIRAVRQNQQQALTWLGKQPNATPEFTQSMQPLLALLQDETAGSHPADPLEASAPPEIAAQPSLNWIGSVTSLTTMQPQDWSPLVKTVSLSTQPPPQQAWYQIAVNNIQIGQQWQKFSASQTNSKSASEQAFLKQPVQLQLMVWQDATLVQTLPLTVKAMQLKQGQLSLLGAGAALPTTINPTVNPTVKNTLVAVTPTITWLQPTASLTLSELMQQPNWQPLMPQLWQALATAHLVPDPQADPLATVGQWLVQQLELTGDHNPEAILTLEPADGGSLRTVVFSNQTLLYSDLQQTEQTLLGLASAANRTMLLVKQGQQLELKQWSDQAQAFE